MLQPREQPRRVEQVRVELGRVRVVEQHAAQNVARRRRAHGLGEQIRECGRAQHERRDDVEHRFEQRDRDLRRVRALDVAHAARVYDDQIDLVSEPALAARDRRHVDDQIEAITEPPARADPRVIAHAERQLRARAARGRRARVHAEERLDRHAAGVDRRRPDLDVQRRESRRRQTDPEGDRRDRGNTVHFARHRDRQRRRRQQNRDDADVHLQRRPDDARANAAGQQRADRRDDVADDDRRPRRQPRDNRRRGIGGPRLQRGSGEVPARAHAERIAERRDERADLPADARMAGEAGELIEGERQCLRDGALRELGEARGIRVDRNVRARGGTEEHLHARVERDVHGLTPGRGRAVEAYEEIERRTRRCARRERKPERSAGVEASGRGGYRRELARVDRERDPRGTAGARVRNDRDTVRETPLPGITGDADERLERVDHRDELRGHEPARAAEHCVVLEPRRGILDERERQPHAARSVGGRIGQQADRHQARVENRPHVRVEFAQRLERHAQQLGGHDARERPCDRIGIGRRPQRQQLRRRQTRTVRAQHDRERRRHVQIESACNGRACVADREIAVDRVRGRVEREVRGPRHESKRIRRDAGDDGDPARGEVHVDRCGAGREVRLIGRRARSAEERADRRHQRLTIRRRRDH